MSYDSKVQSARKIIENHNLNADTKVDFDQFLKKLIDMGGSSEDTLKAVSWEDLQDCGLPRIIARRLGFLFRQESEVGNEKSSYISDRKASTLSYRELLERYNPLDVKNSIGKRLKEISDGKSFVVFDKNGKVLIKETVRLLEDIINGLPPIDTAFINGVPTPTYRIGERPDFFVDENPLYPGRVLRFEETCDQTGRSWTGVNIEIRQLLWIAIKETSELVINSVAEANDVLDRILSNSNVDRLKSRYPEASKLFDEYSDTGRMPMLKIKIEKNRDDPVLFNNTSHSVSGTNICL
jgi:hypothetical protein